MEGKRVNRHLLPPYLREYQLVKLTGWTLEQIDAAPAELCDWLLAIDREATRPMENPSAR